MQEKKGASSVERFLEYFVLKIRGPRMRQRRLAHISTADWVRGVSGGVISLTEKKST